MTERDEARSHNRWQESPLNCRPKLPIKLKWLKTLGSQKPQTPAIYCSDLGFDLAHLHFTVKWCISHFYRAPVAVTLIPWWGGLLLLWSSWSSWPVGMLLPFSKTLGNKWKWVLCLGMGRRWLSTVIRRSWSSSCGSAGGRGKSLSDDGASKFVDGKFVVKKFLVVIILFNCKNTVQQ